MRGALSMAGNFLLVMGVMLMVPFAILLLGLPIAGAVKLISLLFERF